MHEAAPAISPAQEALQRRLIAGVFFCMALGLLVVSMVLTPAEAGMGTHRQMGLPPCGLLQWSSFPCPTCGMTTAFALAAHGQLAEAFQAQPFGAFLALLTGMTVWVAGYVMVTASPIMKHLLRLWRPRYGWLLAALFVVAWLYKIQIVRGVF